MDLFFRILLTKNLTIMKKIIITLLISVVTLALNAQRWLTDSTLPGGVYDKIEYQGDIYIGGTFTKQDDNVPANYILKWDDTQSAWIPVSENDSLLERPAGGVFKLAVFQNELYVAGDFGLHYNYGSGVTIYSFAKWNGTQWSKPAGGLRGNHREVHDLLVKGDSLYFCGWFSSAENTSSTIYYPESVGIWDGSSFHKAIGTNAFLDDYTIKNIEFYKDTLYIGSNVRSINRWDGSGYTPGIGVTDVNDFFVYHDTLFISANELYTYTSSGGLSDAITIPTDNTAKHYKINPRALDTIDGSLWVSGVYRLYNEQTSTFDYNAQQYYTKEYNNNWKSFLIHTTDIPYGMGTSVVDLNGELHSSLESTSSSIKKNRKLSPIGAYFELANTHSLLGIACPGDTILVRSTSMSQNPITDYSWYAPGGNIIVNMDTLIKIVYDTGGEYSVALTVSDGTNTDSLHSEQISETAFIKIVDKPVYSQSNDTIICASDTAILSIDHNADIFGFVNTFNMIAIEGKQDSVYVFPGQTTEYSFLMRNYSIGNIIQCDFYDTITVSTNPVYEIHDTTWICKGSSYVFPDGTLMDSIISPVTHTNKLESSKLCDSIIHRTVNLNPVYYISKGVDICSGDSVMAGGSYQSTSGVYYDSLKTLEQCDSIIETTVNVHPVVQQYVKDSICEGDEIEIAGQMISQPAVIYDTLSTLYDCDSIIEYEVFVKPLPNANIGPDTLWVCDGEQLGFDLHDKTGVDSYTITTGSLVQSQDDSLIITYNMSLPITIVQSDVVGINGCTNRDIVRIQGDDIVNMIMDIPVYNEMSVSFNVSGFPSNVTWWYWDFGDGDTLSGNTSPTHKYKAAGDYEACLITFSGCDSVADCNTISISKSDIDKVGARNINLSPNPVKDEILVDIPGEFDNTVVNIFDITGNSKYHELFNDKENQLIINVSKLKPGLYFLKIKNSDKTYTTRFVK
jgi:PKD repeat protein